MTPPPDSLRVWVCPECGNAGIHRDKRELWHEMTCVERDRATVSVEYLPATDLEQLREALERIAAEPTKRFDPARAYFAQAQDIARAALAKEDGEE